MAIRSVMPTWRRSYLQRQGSGRERDDRRPVAQRHRARLPGSIQVPQLVGLESYASVHHLTGREESSGGLTWSAGGLAGGSISSPEAAGLPTPAGTGTHQPRSLLRIADPPRLWQLRQQHPDPHVDAQGLRAHAGCGIVADSDPDNEAEELMWKLQPLLDAVT